MKRLCIIDALRSVLALWVAIGHAGVFPLFGAPGQNNGILDLIARGFRSIGYSLYLIHPLIIALCFKYEFLTERSRLNSAAMLVLILLGSYLFYLAVERPSHGLAKKNRTFSY